jgi:hypothetical protein
MATWRVGVALALVLSSATAWAEPDEMAPVAIDDVRGTWGVALSMRAGVATTPLASNSFAEAKGHAVVTVLSAYAAVTPPVWIGLQVPLVAASVAQPAGSYLDEAAWGAPRIFAAIQWDRPLRETMSLRTTMRFSAGAPFAEHGPAGWLLENRALSIANAVEGWLGPELYTPGAVPLEATLRLDLATMPWIVSGGVKLPLTLRVSDADLSPERTRKVGFSPTIEAIVAHWRKRFGLSLGTYLVTQVLRIDDAPRPGSRLQLVVRPEVAWRLGENMLLAADVIVPLGGALGGATFGLGVHVAASF